MKIYQFHFKIDQGKIAFKSEQHKDMFNRYLRQFDGKEVEIEITEKKSKRSQQQHKYYFLYLGIISDETGYTTEELHSMFKGKFLTDTIKEIFGEKTRITKSTTGLSVGQFCEYLADIQNFTHIELPNTEDVLGVSYHK